MFTKTGSGQTYQKLNETVVETDASDYPCSTEGPSEHDIVRLADGRLMAVFRTDGGDGHGWQPYSQTFSEDNGQTW